MDTRADTMSDDGSAVGGEARTERSRLAAGGAKQLLPVPSLLGKS
jgi:hypothetical protein